MWQIKKTKHGKYFLICPKGHNLIHNLCFSCLTHIVNDGLDIKECGAILYSPSHLLVQLELLCGS